MSPEVKIPNNSEIDQALKEFEEKSQEEEQLKTPQALKNGEVPKMVQSVIKYSGGIIKEQKTAEYILLGFVVLAIGISLYLFFDGGNRSSPQPSTKVPERIQNRIINNAK